MYIALLCVDTDSLLCVTASTVVNKPTLVNHDGSYSATAFNEIYRDLTPYEDSVVSLAQELLHNVDRPNELAEMCHIHEPLKKDKQWEIQEEMWFAVLFQLTQLHYDKSALFKFSKSPAHRRYLGERGHVYLMHDVFKHLTESPDSTTRLSNSFIEGKTVLENFTHQNKHNPQYKFFKFNADKVDKALRTTFDEGYSTRRSKNSDRRQFCREIELQSLVKLFKGTFNVLLVDTKESLLHEDWKFKLFSLEANNSKLQSKPKLLLISADGLRYTFWRNLCTVPAHIDHQATRQAAVSPVSILQRGRSDDPVTYMQLIPNSPMTSIAVRHKLPPTPPPPPPAILAKRSICAPPTWKQVYEDTRGQFRNTVKLHHTSDNTSSSKHKRNYPFSTPPKVSVSRANILRLNLNFDG